VHRRINGATICGLIMVFVFTTHLLRPFLERTDIWWTPRELAQPPSQCSDRVRVLIHDKPLARHLDEGTLYTIADDGTRLRVAADDVGFRLNNWHAVRARMLLRAVVHAVLVTAGLMLLLFGLFVLPRNRPAAEPGHQDAQR
jgi:hypothetical protein